MINVLPSIESLYKSSFLFFFLKLLSEPGKDVASKYFMVICVPVDLGALDQEVMGLIHGANKDPFNH